MKKLIFLLTFIVSVQCYSQTLDSIIVKPSDLDSQVINGRKYYSLKLGTTAQEKTDIAKALEYGIGATNINNSQNYTLDSLRKRIKDLENATPVISPGASLHKTITSSTYTITEADDNYSLFFMQGCTVNTPALNKLIKVRLYRRGSGTIVISPSITLFGTSANGVYYRRISAGGYADIDYDSNNSAQLTGNLTK